MLVYPCSSDTAKGLQPRAYSQGRSHTRPTLSLCSPHLQCTVFSDRRHMAAHKVPIRRALSVCVARILSSQIPALLFFLASTAASSTSLRYCLTSGSSFSCDAGVRLRLLRFRGSAPCSTRTRQASRLPEVAATCRAVSPVLGHAKFTSVFWPHSRSTSTGPSLAASSSSVAPSMTFCRSPVERRPDLNARPGSVPEPHVDLVPCFLPLHFGQQSLPEENSA